MHDDYSEVNYMDIKQLSYFVEVAKQKNFTKASNILHLTQPTLSKMVKSLEDELEVELIDRSSRKIELTDAGEIVFEQGQKILASIDEVSLLLYDLMNLKKGKIKIGLPPLIGVLFFPEIIKGFQDLYPGVTIELTEVGANKVKALVEDGEIDLGVVVLPVEADRFNVIPFVSEEMQLFVHSSHPIASQTEISLERTHEESFILFNEAFMLHDKIIEECIKAGFTPNVSYESSQWDFIVALVEQNIGVAILPQPIEKKINHENVKAIKITNPVIPWELGVILKKDRYVSYITREFLRYMNDRQNE
jgi:DNA-binding transcriptional LysR family regulator